VFAALGASGALFSLAGAVVGGVAASYVGVTAMLEVAASLVLLAGVVVLRALPRLTESCACQGSTRFDTSGSSTT
jgi:hypothetical protein